MTNIIIKAFQQLQFNLFLSFIAFGVALVVLHVILLKEIIAAEIQWSDLQEYKTIIDQLKGQVLLAYQLGQS